MNARHAALVGARGVLVAATAAATAPRPRARAEAAGQRQMPDATPGASPLGRLNTRLQTRVPSRLQTRIAPGADALEADAGARVRAATDQARGAAGPN